MKNISIISIILFIFSCNNKSNTKLTYKVASEKILGNHAAYKIIIPDSTSKENLIRIAYDLKSQLIWENNFVCHFYLKGSHLDYGAWASVSYLPRCHDCANEKDPAGNDVEYKFIGLK